MKPITTAITPGITYRDAPAAMKWLCEVLGFKVTMHYEDSCGGVAYAQLEWRDGAVEVSSRQEGGRLPSAGPSSIVLTAADAAEVDRLYECATNSGATIAIPMEDTFYGCHGFSVLDPEGNQWHIGTPWKDTEAARQTPGKVALSDD